MIQHLPDYITCISSPLIHFYGDTSLCEYIADHYFRDGSTHYAIEIRNEESYKKKIYNEKQECTYPEPIFKGSWYMKHSREYPALCLFCININVVEFSQDHVKWLQSVTEKFNAIANSFSKRKPVFLSIFNCLGNRDTLLQHNVREDSLIREYPFYYFII